ncbi:hypothetical protein [Pontiella sp.]|uniref:hypothetical protein n=1 Tax=Pontiella sp. TaxID=2837462 RepID=UPI003562A692
MTPLKFALPALVVCALLAGCQSNNKKTAEDGEILMPKMQQNTYLSHARAPQEFGFAAYPVGNGIGFQGTGHLHPNHMATVEFLKGKVPVIEMRGMSKRKKINMLLDTSSNASWMEFINAEEFGAIFLGIEGKYVPYRGGYNTGGADAYAAVVKQMRINQLFIENTPLYVRMAMNSLGPMARGIVKPTVEGVMGYDVMRNFEYIQFNLDQGAVQFSASIPYVPNEQHLMTKARIVPQKDYGLAVEGAIFGTATPIILDFAGDFHFVRSDAKVAITKQVSIGDIVYRKVPTMLYPVDETRAAQPLPRAGRRMLEDYVVTICPKLGLVYFERYSK